MTVATHESVEPVVTTLGTTGGNLIREAAAVMADAHVLAKAVCTTQMIPKHFQGRPDECAAAMLYGASLGLDPMQAVRQIYVVHGQAALYARAMSALTLGAGHQVWTVASSDEAVTVAGRRRGSEHAEEITWDYKRAQKAGYTNNNKYATDPQAMLYAKALSEVCRKIAPDVLSGVYAVEELQMERWEERSPAFSDQSSEPRSTSDRMAAMVGEPAPENGLLDTSSALAKRLYAGMRDAGIDDDDRLAFLSEVTGRDIASSKELTTDEASRCIDALPVQGEITEPQA